MLINDWMTKNVITADDEMSIMQASAIMRSKSIRYLPIVDAAGRLAGVVTDRDLKAAAPSKATSLDVFELHYLLANVEVKEIMTRNVIWARPSETVELAAVLMIDNKISGMPVVDTEMRVVGVITQVDIFRALVTITGAYQDGVQFALNLDDRPGSLKEAADEIRAHGGRIVSVLTHYPNAGGGLREVYFRIHRVEPPKLAELKEALASKFRLLNVVEDFVEETRRRRKK
ncbi:MAG: CBS domain-containing protein [Nitrospinae bacterium]|nr:CBS domain-containing protein [Nitrospinota bacterium]